MTQKNNIIIYWRILFDVVDGQPRLRKEFTLWDRANRRRLYSGTIMLEILEEVQVSYSSDSVIFTNGYLKCKDEDVRSHIDKRYRVSTANDGENVSVWAEVGLPQGDGQYPLFYYPQTLALERPYLTLSLEGAATTRCINWEIEKQRIKAVGPYHISGSDSWHRVWVRQDQDWTRKGNRTRDYFEFLADSVLLARADISAKDGSFTFEPVEDFYIGQIPDPANPGSWVKLTGEIRRLEFDPNDSCATCGGVKNAYLEPVP